MVLSENRLARLDSICAIKQSSNVFIILDNVKDVTTHTLNNIESGKELYFNIFAINEKDRIAVPYKPIALFIPELDRAHHMRILFVLILLILLCGFLGVYFFIKARYLKN